MCICIYIYMYVTSLYIRVIRSRKICCTRFYFGEEEGEAFAPSLSRKFRVRRKEPIRANTCGFFRLCLSFSFSTAVVDGGTQRPVVTEIYSHSTQYETVYRSFYLWKRPYATTRAVKITEEKNKRLPILFSVL